MRRRHSDVRCRSHPYSKPSQMRQLAAVGEVRGLALIGEVLQHRTDLAPALGLAPEASVGRSPTAEDLALAPGTRGNMPACWHAAVRVRALSEELVRTDGSSARTRT